MRDLCKERRMKIMGRKKAIKNMELQELVQSMNKEFTRWEVEEFAWSFESLVLHDDMAATNELKQLFRSTNLDLIPSTRVLLDEIYADRLEQLAEREKFAQYAKRLLELLKGS